MSDVVVENRLVEKESDGYHDDVGDTTLVLEFAVLLKILEWEVHFKFFQLWIDIVISFFSEIFELGVDSNCLHEFFFLFFA